MTPIILRLKMPTEPATTQTVRTCVIWTASSARSSVPAVMPRTHAVAADEGRADANPRVGIEVRRRAQAGEPEASPTAGDEIIGDLAGDAERAEMGLALEAECGDGRAGCECRAAEQAERVAGRG